MKEESKTLIEMYSEPLSEYIAKTHEAAEGRYNLSGYDLHVIEAALNELIDLKTQPNN
jgi:hypothetical protein